MEPSCTSRPFNSRSHRFKHKQAYPPQSYISVTANGPSIGDGAVGIIYRVSVQMEMASGTKHHRHLILKLAVGSRKEKIIEEYKYYKLLAEADITNGIIGVHGLFCDMEMGAMMILMEDAGKSVRRHAYDLGLDPEDECVKLVDQDWCLSSLPMIRARL